MDWFLAPIVTPSQQFYDQAVARQKILTKPLGSLGRLESLAASLAAMQSSAEPKITRPAISIFAGDHGIAEEGVSAFPQIVTTEMVKNFSAGGAAVSVLAGMHHAVFEVVNLGTVIDPGILNSVVNARIAAGTANFAHQQAMTENQLYLSMNEGAESVTRAISLGADLYIGGEMGIANTTSASAICAALLDIPLDQLVGPGTGIDSTQLQHKHQVIQKALILHSNSLQAPLTVLQSLGGFEIAGLVGAYIKAAQSGLPILVDGFITTAAALVACRINSDCRPWLLFSHGSAEPGHRKVLSALDAEPLIDLNLRLGEASGAAITIPLLQQACALHNGMATFSQAAVTDRA